MPRTTREFRSDVILAGTLKTARPPRLRMEASHAARRLAAMALVALVLLVPAASATHETDPLNGHVVLDPAGPTEALAEAEAKTNETVENGAALLSEHDEPGELIGLAENAIEDATEAISRAIAHQLEKICPESSEPLDPVGCVEFVGGQTVQRLCVTFERVGPPVAGFQPRKPVVDTERGCEGFVKMPED